MKKIIIILLGVLTFAPSIGQECPKHLKVLYNKIYTSMSNGSIIKPELRLIDDSNFECSKKEVASYSPVNKTITVGQSFLDLTRKFGEDSSNARAHVLSHELAHLFLNHGFTSIIGTGFSSIEINRELKKAKQDIADKTDELEADQWAFFYAYTSGFKTNTVAPKLLDSIYKNYNLNDKLLSKYPSLSERKKYAIDASVKMKTMCEAFDFANLTMIHGDYDMAIDIYSAIVQEGFKSREIVSNLGTSYVLKAMELMDSTETNFVLPLQIDMNSRLLQENVRGITNSDEITDLLNRSIELYKQAVTIDPDYCIAYLNLSMAYWLLKETTDSEYNLQKAKNSNCSSYLNKIEVFEAIKLFNSSDKQNKKEGILLLNKLASDGNYLAKANLNIINKENLANSENRTLPGWLIEISETKLSSNFQNATNLLDSTFSKDKYKRITCKEIDGDITYRKWKSIKEESNIVLQYIYNENVQKTISESDKLNLFLKCQSVFETSNKTYLRFKDVILIIDSNNNVKYQIIKGL